MAIAWTESVPSGTSQAGQGPAQFKSVWTSVGVGLGVQGDLLWGGSGGASDTSAGYFNYGGSRAFYDVQSNSSTTNSQFTGRAFLASDTSQFLVYDSATTQLGGTPFLIEFGPQVSAGSIILRLSSSITIASGSTTTFATVAFPIVLHPTPTAVIQTSSDSRYILGIAGLTGAGFESNYSWMMSGTQSAFTIEWLAVGFGAIGQE